MTKINRIFTYIDQNFYDLLLWGLVMLNIGPFLAPILAKLGLTIPAHIIYFIYSFFCHQLDWRSLHVFDYQYAWCVRDTFIWLNILTAALMTRKWNIKPIKWYWLVAFVIPIALDGGVQTIATLFGFLNSDPLYMSTNLMRMLTGSIFGLGFGLWIMPNMMDITVKSTARKEFPFRKKVILPILVLINVVIYLLLVFIWNVTSINHKPENFVDFAVKTPTNPEEWLVRRKDGV